MFISSSYRKKPHESGLNFNLRPLPMKGTRRRNPDEDFVLSGHRNPIECKPRKYRTNTQMTLKRTGSSDYIQASVSKTDIPITGHCSSESDTECESHLQNDEELDIPEPELMRLKEDTLYVDDSKETTWYLDPIHRAQSAPPDLEEMGRRTPLQASVLRSKMEGLLYPTPQEVIDKTPIESFDISLFRNAEDEMLSCRTLTALTSPYQYKLAKLRMERLRIEEDRLLQIKTLSELERIRGPTPHWYEMKTPGFHVEARKNNQLLASKGHYKEIMSYRHELLGALERSQMTNFKN